MSSVYTHYYNIYKMDEKNLKVEYLPCLNYAMALNGRKCMEYCEISNNSSDDLHTLKVEVNGEMIQHSETTLDIVPAGQTIRITDIQVMPDIDKLRELTESVETKFQISIHDNGNELFSKTYPLRLLAFDEWPGISVAPEMLAAFVTPNAPEISKIKVNAAQYIEKLTGSSALDEYQTQDPNRVRAQVAGIFEALRSEQLIYSAPPASYEKNGQRVRLVDKVLSEKLGTCLDLSLLFASCLEACGLHPVLVLQQGHMYIGCWLVDKYYYQTVCDDISILSKSMADGISEMVLVEATDVAASGKVTFEEAVDHATHHIVAEENKFVLFCDIHRCRLEGIRPLPVRINGEWQLAGISHSNDTKEMKEMRVEKIEPRQSEEKLTRQQIWERKLLDFSLRNNLINIRIGKRVIPFVSFNVEDLENNLNDGSDYQILPNPAKKKLEANEFGIYDSRKYKEELETVVIEDLKHDKLRSYLTEEELKTITKTLFRDSRTELEENGANSLFLVMGLLKWYENDKSVRPRYAPLLLLPVDIIRKSGNNYVIRKRDEDITFNTTLIEMLKQQHDIQMTGLSPLPEDESGIDVRQVFSIVRSHIANHPKWDIIEESLLGLFSFNKFVMWNDIHNNADKMRKNTIIDSLIQKHWTGKESVSTTDARKIDQEVEPHEYAIPVDVDSSQMEAVVESGEGRSFILYGPPGSGKSQTITNMIANALYHGKRVLFVAEKMAALSVVQKRLAKIGLDPFCLEMHSNKITKTHLLHQLQTTLELTRIKEPEQYEATSRDLFRQRQNLIGYMDKLHRKHASGLSLYDCITRYESIKGDSIPPSGHFLKDINDGKLREAAEKIATLDTVFNITGQPSQHPLQGLNIYDASQQTQEELTKRLLQMTEQIQAADQLITQVNEHAGYKQPHSVDGAKWVMNLAESQESLTQNYTSQILSQDPAQLRNQWEEVCGKWVVSKFFAKKSFMNTLKTFKSNMSEDDIQPMISQLEKYKMQLKEAGLQQAPVFPTAYVKTCKDLLANLEQIKDKASFDSIDFPTLLRQFPEWTQNIDKSRNWAQWCIRKRELEELHLDKVISYMNQNSTSASSAAQAMLKGAYEQLALRMIDEDKELQMFNGLLFEDIIYKYRELAKNFQELTKKMLYCKLAANVPSQALEPSSSSELGILKRYISSNGRGATIRHIMDQIPTLLPRLCPVMLMSPISVAQYIDLDQPPFDIVCFDEASQMPTSEAVGAIARGKALICVGDPKQMPPTSFFSTNAVDETEADIDDMESILDDCITLSLPARYLTWHYRSRHESLIAFSNMQYYDGKLFTFPSVDDRASKVQFIPVNGTYDFGKTRSNRAEAEAIVKEVVRRLSDKELSMRSIGIVSFSKVQQNLIEDLLTEELAKYPELEKKAYDVEEPIFIKNLENVQGDERDIILFSIGYGPDKTGKVSMNFGPLNNAGGERRLNVAVSRARYEMMVFSTLKPEQIDLNRSNARGVEGLKHFLEFAKNGRLAISANQIKKDYSLDIIELVANAIRALGYDVDTTVGRSQFKVDIAVLNPKQKDQYLLGIQCDGKNYYETKTERDREICQPGVLKGLGWNLLRVWSVDWFMNKDAVMQRITKKLDELMNPSQEKTPEEKPTEQPKPQTLVSNMPFAVTKEELVGEIKNEKLVPYERIKLTGNHDGTIEHVLRSEKSVTNDIQKLIVGEQPITQSLICKRIAETYGLSRVTVKLQDFIAKLKIPNCYIDPSSPADNPIYWKDAASAKEFVVYRQGGDRDISDIPMLEIMNAVKYAVEQQVSIPLDGLKKQATQMLGFARKLQKADLAVEMAIAQLIDNGELNEENGTITLSS